LSQKLINLKQNSVICWAPLTRWPVVALQQRPRLQGWTKSIPSTIYAL